MNSVFKLLSLFTPRERRGLIPLTITILCASFLELISVSSLGPLMAVVVDPGIVRRQRILAYLYRIGGFQNDHIFLIFLGTAVFMLVLLAAALKIGALYHVNRFAAKRRYTLGLRLFKQYLYQPYRYFLDHNTSELSKSILNEVDASINGVLLPAMNTLVYGLITAALFVFIVIINPFLTLAALGVFGTVYNALYFFVRSRLSRYGKDRWDANTLRYKTAAEAFGGIKDIKILGKEPFFVYSYGLGARRYASAEAANQILSNLPSSVMQSLAIGFTIAMMIVLLLLRGSFSQIASTLAAFAFAIMRMVPGFQNTFQNAAQIRYHTHIVDNLHKDITTLVLPPDIPAKPILDREPEPVSFDKSITLEKIEFSYPISSKPVLRGINLRIPKNATVALVGATGCGKTTLVDVIMGLLEPSSGSILADDMPVNAEDISRWQRNFGYVPQQVFLSDDTMASNIAFGIPVELQDRAAVERAARVANLHNFISAELPNGYNTVVGERGIRLSGGQRQRVGIARSLYHDPHILVMDEATSALDSVTEESVMDAIHNLMHSKTIIIIAHRISTVRECDMICLMEKGRIIARGTYDELLMENAHFRAMAKVEKKAV
ncbi:MAG: ABC transporter ATP-binding protein/permease [Treponema sp.]|jgi:ABC-type multidrug transport system fused ATPase/permease subunit|nr:ABC transporter ATP-binding protein/permease [Treponema sp.]